MQRDGIARVVVAVADPTLREAAASALAENGYAVTRVSDAGEAVEVVRSSAWPLAVVFTLDCLDLLASVVPDVRLGCHHAYIALLPEGSGVAPRWVDWYPQLMLSTLTLPLDHPALLAAVTRATRGLGVAQPA